MKQKQDKGTAGLTVLLSLIVSLFVIGLLVMIFVIMSGKIQDTNTLYTTSSSISVVNESVTPTTAGVNLANALKRNAVCSTVTCKNGTAGTVITGNYTVTGCKVANTTGVYSAYKCTYSYVYDYDRGGAMKVINDTGTSVAGVTDWFDIFIVIGAMVVLILLTVIIVTAIRSSGLVGGEAVKKGNSVGTA